jgi:hypothetical protein
MYVDRRLEKLVVRNCTKASMLITDFEISILMTTFRLLFCFDTSYIGQSQVIVILISSPISKL